MNLKLTSVFLTGIYLALSPSLVLADTNNQMNTESRSNSVGAQGRQSNTASDAGGMQNTDRNGGVDNEHSLNGDSSSAAANRESDEYRNRDESQLTADQQLNNKKDLNITQQIRKSLMDNPNLSTSAKNIKVITRKGKVVLKGLVFSAQEKSASDKIAKNVAGNANVQNDLTVKK